MAEVCGVGWECCLWKEELLLCLFFMQILAMPHELEGFGHRTSKEKNNLLISFI